MVTTIKLMEKTKDDLEKFREYSRESYEEIVRKLIYVAETAKNEPHLSKKTIEDIEAARERIRKGSFYTEDEAKRILGL